MTTEMTYLVLIGFPLILVTVAAYGWWDQVKKNKQPNLGGNVQPTGWKKFLTDLGSGG